MLNVFYENLEVDEEISRERVAEEDDLGLLAEWSEQLRQQESELHTMVTSVTLADADRALGMARKLGYVRVARNWVRDRILSLDGEVPNGAMGQKYKRLAHTLTMANQQLEKKNKRLKELRAEVETLRTQLRAAQAGVTRTGGDGEAGSVAEGDSTRSEGCAPTPSPKDSDHA